MNTETKGRETEGDGIKLTYKALFLTNRAPVHQKLALESAPDFLEVQIIRDPARSEIEAAIRDKQFLISEREGVIDDQLLSLAPDLKMVVRLGSRVWDIDLESAKTRGVRVCKVPLASCEHVAEHMVMQMLMLSRRVRESMTVVQERDWDGKPFLCTEDTFGYNWSGRSGIELLKNGVVGIYGFGEIGTELALRLRGFGCEVRYHKRNPLPEAAEQMLGVRYAGQQELLKESDVICSLVPFFDNAGPRADSAFFDSMKEGSYFLHCGGSGVVQEDALLAALDSGKLAGAALDTFSWEPIRKNEPVAEYAARPRANLVLTPHVAAGGTSMKGANSRKAYYEDIVRFLRGSQLRYPIV